MKQKMVCYLFSSPANGPFSELGWRFLQFGLEKLAKVIERAETQVI